MVGFYVHWVKKAVSVQVMEESSSKIRFLPVKEVCQLHPEPTLYSCSFWQPKKYISIKKKIITQKLIKICTREISLIRVSPIASSPKRNS